MTTAGCAQRVKRVDSSRDHLVPQRQACRRGCKNDPTTNFILNLLERRKFSLELFHSVFSAA